MAEEERTRLKAAAKKAKKQKQKAKKQQPSVSSNAVAEAATPEPEAGISLCGALATQIPAASEEVIDVGQHSAVLQGQLQDLTTSSETAEDQTAAFLTQLFCCPLTQVWPMLNACLHS